MKTVEQADGAERAAREYPPAPIVGVGGVVIRGGTEVLLIRRGQEPMLGRWSLPGGALEVGETLAEGVAREVLEETGLRVEPLAIVATLDRIVRDEAQRVRFHYVLVDWVCRVVDRGGEGTLLAGDDAEEAVWGRREDLARYGLEPLTLRVIEDGFRQMEAS